MDLKEIEILLDNNDIDIDKIEEIYNELNEEYNKLFEEGESTDRIEELIIRLIKQNNINGEILSDISLINSFNVLDELVRLEKTPIDVIYDVLNENDDILNYHILDYPNITKEIIERLLDNGDEKTKIKAKEKLDKLQID
ncbi:hypothetical protein N5U00_02075 [Aliarcobacter butzleri]|uniref:hypothetical protein n=1 Tax=Aliarcobacter butzleri TaxID=28197 RepID=UPI0021B6D6BA|nr:hypothetical protein [Aliarcobacter butzleri]MCT7574104.1 hypothetical protein [Aliarcobacter butzleri]